MPILATEQYPKGFFLFLLNLHFMNSGLGRTVEELSLTDSNIKVFQKTRFSMCPKELDNVKSIILCGIEAHVCILHTTLDLLEKGYNVHVVTDATSSRSLPDR